MAQNEQAKKDRAALVAIFKDALDRALNPSAEDATTLQRGAESLPARDLRDIFKGLVEREHGGR